MGFAQELKEFVGGFKAGSELAIKANEAEARAEYYRKDRSSPAEKQKAADKAAWEAEAKRAGITDPSAAPPVVEAADEGNITDAGGEGGEGSQISYEQLEKNITAQESGGNYKAIGPTHPTLGRALGYAQVMEANLPQWSKDAIGRVVSADEFLNNPDLQKQIVRKKLGSYYEQYGPAGAASAWFTGSPTPKGKKDSLGTRDYDYVRRATRTAAVPIDPEDRPIMFAASGGLVDDDYAGNDESGGSNPAVRDAVEKKDYNPRDLIDSGTPMEDIVDDGVQLIQRKLQPEGQGVDTNADQRVQAFARNVGAPKPEEVRQMKDTVDPDKKLPEALRPVAAWKGMYDYYTKQGRPAEAQRAAAAMLMYTRAVMTQGGYIAQAALEKNDVKGAANAIAGALNEAPDGKRMEVGEVTKKGVKYKIYDETTGELTDEGEAKQDQILKMATGLSNGTEWMRGVGAMKAKTRDKVGERQEAERSALEDFSAKSGQGVIGEFMKGLESDEARESFKKLPASRQFQIAQADAQKDRAEAAQKGLQSRYDRRENMSVWKEAIKHERWEQDRERMMSRDEIAQSQRQQDLDDRNTRFDQSQEARKARQRQHDAAVLARRDAAAGRGGSAGERADMALDRERNVAQQDVYRTGDPNDELGVDLGTQSRLQAVDVGTGFNKMANDPSRKIDRDAVKELPNAITTEWEAAAKDEKGNLRKDYKPPTRQQTMLLTDIASDIMRGDFDQTRAAQLAIDATSPGAKIQAHRDGTVTINNSPPVRLSERSFMELARIHGKTGNINKTGLGPQAAIPVDTPTGNRSAGGPAMGGALVTLDEAVNPTGAAPRRRGISARDQVAANVGIRMTDDEYTAPRRAWTNPTRDWTNPERQPVAPRDWTDVPSRREWVDPPAHQAATTSKYDKNPARRRKEMRESRRRGVPI